MRPSKLGRAFDNVMPQMGACGIWCGSCAVGTGVLQELTRRYEKLLDSHGLEEWGPQDFDWSEFTRGLASIQQVPVCPGCEQGGGRDDCELRTCAGSTSLPHCGACHAGERCPHADLLQDMRSGALKAGLIVDTGAERSPAQIEQWTAQWKSGWPGCVLFTERA